MTEIRRESPAEPERTPPRLRIVETSTPAAGPGTAPTTVSAPLWARRYQTALVITDIAVITTSVLIAFVTRFWWGDVPMSIGTVFGPYSVITGVVIITWIITLGVNHTRDARVVGIGATEYRRVVNASVLTFGLLAILFLILKVDVARGFFVLALPIGLGGLLLSRWLWRHWLIRQRSQGKFLSRAIVVGDLADVQYVIGQIERNAISAYHIIGAAVDSEHLNTVSVNSRGVEVVSSLQTVAEAAARLNVDTVIVAGQPAGGGNFIRDLGWDLEGTAAELVVASRLTNIAGPRIHFRPVEGLPLMHVELPQYAGGKHIAKRALDIVCSASALLFLAPLMIVIAWAVRRDSAGPVLFRQERVGRGGKTFFMLKFRSMVQTAEDDLAGLLDKNEGAGVLFKMKNDPRVTRIGRVLRKYSLDELPQLWNILVGEMSIVGPRPPLQSEVASYEDRVHRRLYIKPGLTGMWQVNGRSNLDWDESVRLDLYYVENWSLTGDLLIMWRTLKVLRNASGAY